MEIPLISDYNPEDMKNFLAELTKEYNKDEAMLRKILEERKTTLSKKKEELTQLKKEKEIQTQLEKEKEREISKLEREIKSILGGEIAFKRDHISNVAYLETLGDYILPEEECVGYEIKINFNTRQVYFDIDPENLSSSMDDRKKEFLYEYRPDEDEIYRTLGEIADEDEIIEIEEQLILFEEKLILFEENIEQYRMGIQRELEKYKEDLSNLEQRLINHKEQVLATDYILRKFAKEKGYEYITNHTFPIPENKNQLKLEYAFS